MKELLRSVQVEKSATENDIEDPIPLEVPNVVIDKRQIRKASRSFTKRHLSKFAFLTSMPTTSRKPSRANSTE